MTERCPVCHGSGRVRLPLYRDVVPSFRYRHDISVQIEESSRQYPCPECKADSAPFERVQTISESCDVVTAAMPKINEAVRYNLARKLAEWLLEHEMITFEVGDPSFGQYRREVTPVRGTLSVVSPKNIATLQERIEAWQFEVAELLIAESKRQINNWGSNYNYTSVSKDQAYRLIRESLGAVKSHLSRMKFWDQ